MYQRANHSMGLNTNVSLEPSANTQNTQHITNNIIVGREHELGVNSELAPAPEPAPELGVNSGNSVPVPEIAPILLEIYQGILLSQNKVLLANILSKKHIIVYKNDLERIISAKVGKKCSVVLKEIEGCGCTAANSSPFAVVDSIVIYENDHRVDFKVAYNADYVELNEKYALSLKLCIIA